VTTEQIGMVERPVGPFVCGGEEYGCQRCQGWGATGRTFSAGASRVLPRAALMPGFSCSDPRSPCTRGNPRRLLPVRASYRTRTSSRWSRVSARRCSKQRSPPESRPYGSCANSTLNRTGTRYTFAAPVELQIPRFRLPYIRGPGPQFPNRPI